MKKIVILIIVLTSITKVFSQNEKKWTLKEINQSIENKNEFIEHLVIDKNYYENKTEYYERNNISLFVNDEQAVYIYPSSINFYFNKKNDDNYKQIIDLIKKSGTKINFKELEIRDEKLWVLIYKVKSNYIFIYKDPANNRYLEISKNKEIK